MNLNVGDTIWEYNHNLTPRDEKGRIAFRRQFVSRRITGETRVSWLVGEGWNQVKIPKKTELAVVSIKNGNYSRVFYLTPESMNQEVWLHENAWGVYKSVERCRDIAVLKQIAALVGYKERT